MTAYQRLSPRRTWTAAGPAAIPLTEIEAYARLAGLSRQDSCDLVDYIDALDRAYLDDFYAKVKPTE